ncbi:hypothetical protein BDB00DRAFT_426042 [Zychaea mexicana]|uniref:uncharacterized protein n=1 Tax=Zychaea mexicana TaxID=64656 RepID=UPI0022FF376B|nr:uncharacterized protein BDB00DRAFT_426042 [Zychaea mexicana]KAI9492627.1 hypothetical protein BDB00DRAFT_426042 [Zychaea mexicana]
MSPMPHKSAFEPKDPRIINLYEDDDDEDELDDWSLTTTSDVTPRPRRKKTGTQALVEFLNTTSPEEFEKKSPKRTSNLFFRRRNKNKPPTAPSSTSSTPTPSTTSSYLTSFNSRHDVIGGGGAGAAAAPNTIHRKNYIEIIPNHIANPILSREASSSTSLTRVASRTPSLASRQSAAIRRSVISNSDQQQAPQNQNPLLPSNRSIKQRESSLYSDSIRHSMSTKSHSLRGRPLMRHDTDATLGTKSSITSGLFQRRTSEHTFGGQLEQQQGSVVGANNGPSTIGGTDLQHPHAPNQQQLEERDRKATETMVSHFASQDDLETVESALLQRLERFRLSKMDKPSDVVAAGLATEHVRALQASTQEYEVSDQQQLCDPNNNGGNINQQQQKTKKKVRHMQVQTMPLEALSPPNETFSSSTDNSNTNEASSSTATSPTTTTVNNNNRSSSSSHTAVISASTSTGTNTTSDDPVIAQLQQQLAEEQKQRKHLEAALEETCDHFEVLSGLAYKKLRELWEERTRWENACIELRDRLLEMNQGPSSMEDLNDFANSDYVVEEEKEDGRSK